MEFKFTVVAVFYFDHHVDDIDPFLTVFADYEAAHVAINEYAEGHHDAVMEGWDEADREPFVPMAYIEADPETEDFRGLLARYVDTEDRTDGDRTEYLVYRVAA